MSPDVAALLSQAKQLLEDRKRWFELARIVADIAALTDDWEVVVKQGLGKSRRWVYHMKAVHEYRCTCATNLDAFEGLGWTKFEVLVKASLIGFSEESDLYWLVKARDTTVANLHQAIQHQEPVGSVLLHLPLGLKRKFLDLLLACGATHRRQGRRGSLENVPFAVQSVCNIVRGAIA